jgi:ornithine cyclodeaminase/alanine dehydrogenase-like protein (mu-crystallin family)
MSGAHHTSVLTLDAAAVRASLRIADCLPLIPPAMIALSDGTAKQLLRSFIPMGEGRTFAQMPAALSERGYFGAKIVSVFADPDNPGRRAHDGAVVLFEGERGRIVCVADAGEITRIRTAAASAAATGALARKDASVLAILGGGVQALAHLEAMLLVRPIREIRAWTRSRERGQIFAAEAARLTPLPIGLAETAQNAVAGADIICTVTSASEPILQGAWVAPGAHVNAVGSSAPVPAEIDADLVVRARFFADHRAHVLAHGAEFLRARAAGLIDDDHIVAEIGEVYSGANAGRRSDDEVTLYKSLGHAVQDLAALSWIYERCRPA